MNKCVAFSEINYGRVSPKKPDFEVNMSEKKTINRSGFSDRHQRIFASMAVNEAYTVKQVREKLKPTPEEADWLEKAFVLDTKYTNIEEFAESHWLPPSIRGLRDLLNSLSKDERYPMTCYGPPKPYKYVVTEQPYLKLMEVLRANSAAALVLRNHIASLPWLAQSVDVATETEAVKQLFTLNSGGHIDYTPKVELINEILGYINNRTEVEIHYLSYTGNTNTYNGFCLQLVHHNGALYLLFHNASANDNVYAFQLERVESFTRVPGIKTQLTATVLASYDNPLAGRFGITDGEVRDVTLFVAKEHAHHFKNRTWYPGQTQDAIQEVQNGIRLNFTLPLNNELYAWILGWGGVIEVLAPRELIETIHDRATTLAQVHTPKSTGSQQPDTP